ncbi:hypothetical protein NTGZN8_130163 [Candidatus Nitrotoga fabula]|uniref:Uncharacterized protein n=1 Tax=Candidatus Nitrotoga fabula TaxID=2182327 RepID=A0A916BDL0_9PROT|nr:hypothetical protein NTGZN8_130163 [Candidatus Nitrotoga fabula]
MYMRFPCERPAVAQSEFLASLKRDSGYESKCIVSDYSGCDIVLTPAEF